MPTKPKILNRALAAKSALFRIESLELEFSNGEVRQYERLLGNHPAVIIVPILSPTEVVMVREYGAGVDDYELVLPKGKVDPGEDFVEAANRELMEEAGFGAKRLTLLKQMSQSPNYMQHRTQIVLAESLYEATAEGDEPEPLIVELAPFDQLAELTLRDDVNEARTIAALFLAAQFIKARSEQQ